MAKISSYTTITTPTSSDFVFMTTSGVGNSKITFSNLASGALPSQTGQSGKYLGTNGSSLVWSTPSGGSAGSYVALSGTESISGVKTFASSPVFNTIAATQVHYGQSVTGSPNLTFDGSTLSGSALVLQAPLGLAYGGHGTATASGAINTIVPSQAGNSGQFLTTNGVAVSWSGALPSQGSQSGKILATNGVGTLWVASGGAGGSTSPGGANSNIQYNNSGAFAGSANLVFDYSGNQLGVNTNIPQAPLHVKGPGVAAQLIVQDSTNSGTASQHLVSFYDSIMVRQFYIFKGNTGSVAWNNEQSAPVTFAVGGNTRLTLDAGNNTIHTHLYPSLTNSYDLGNTNAVYRGFYAQFVNCSGLNINAEITGALIPDTHKSRNIGTTSKNWATGYFDFMSVTGISVITEITGNWIPEANKTRNLGSTTKNWASGYIDFINASSINIINEITGSLIPEANKTRNIGSTTKNYSSGFIDFLSISGFRIANEVTGSWIPEANKTRNLGSTTKNWSSGYIDFINVSSVRIVNEITGNIMPDAHVTRNVGTTAKFYATGYFDNLTVNKLVVNTTNSGTSYQFPICYGWSLPSGTISGSGVNVSYEIPIINDCSLVSGGGGYAQIRSKNFPSGGSSGFVLDINYNGTSIWSTTQTNRLKIASGSNTGFQSSFDNTGILARGGYLSLDFDVVGSAIFPQDVIVELLTIAQR